LVESGNFAIYGFQEIASEFDANAAKRCSSCQVDKGLGSIEAFRPLGHADLGWIWDGWSYGKGSSLAWNMCPRCPSGYVSICGNPFEGFKRIAFMEPLKIGSQRFLSIFPYFHFRQSQMNQQTSAINPDVLHSLKLTIRP